MSETIFIRQSEYNRVKDVLTDLEKDALLAAKLGDVICPRGAVINRDETTIPILRKMGMIE